MSATTPSFALLMRRPVLLLGFGFGAGLSPRAPGTAGTVVGVLLYLPLAQLPISLFTAVVVLAFGVGVWICGRSAETLGVHDHPGIVLDEIVGIWVTYIALPNGIVWLVAGFILFRLFDILKPWPIRPIDRGVGGGFGIMADDIVAGLMALVVLQVAARLGGFA